MKDVSEFLRVDMIVMRQTFNAELTDFLKRFSLHVSLTNAWLETMTTVLSGNRKR